METILAKRRKLSNTPGRFSNMLAKPVCYSEYKTLEKRIETYKKWPIPDIQNPEQLAEAGLFYEGKKDLTRCFSCGGGHIDWLKEENPSFEHAKYFPRCTFLFHQRGKAFVDNVRQTLKEKYSTKESRLSTFNDFWPRSIPKAPDELAEAGFFFTGHNIGVQCFECGVTIQNWRVDDVAWFKHAKLKPSCKFISDNKGSKFLAAVKRTVMPYKKDPGEEHTKSKRNLDQPIRNEYKTVEKRIASFKNWPIPKIKTPEELAKIGFYYTGYEDYVNCFNCDGAHFSWKDSEDPAVEHVRWYPACEYIRQMMGEEFVEGVRKKFRDEYATEESRKETFKDWPENANKTPEELYRAGFFSTENEDQTQCFECGFWHIDWEIYDDPWFIHVKLNPTCKFVHLVKGELFVNEVEQALYSASKREVFRTRKRSTTSEESSDTDDSDIRTVMESPTVRAVLNVGFDECRIIRALRSYFKLHKEFKNIEELLAVLIDSQKQDPEVSVCLQNLKKENDLLTVTKVCKICNKQGPLMVYVPCGHLHSCCVCVGMNLKNCIACQEKVTHKLEMFPKKK